jgi:hypothetical protein
MQFADSFKCKLTGKVMRVPVICSDGYSYERRAIKRYFAAGNTQSPNVEGKQLDPTMMIPNRALFSVIQKHIHGY